jgi:hypothetical protein
MVFPDSSCWVTHLYSEGVKQAETVTIRLRGLSWMRDMVVELHLTAANEIVP